MKTFIAMVTLVSSVASWASCPKLEGSYQCPQTSFQEPIKIQVERTQSEDKHTYVFSYEGIERKAQTTAAVTGNLNSDGIWSYCMNNELIYFRTDSTKGWIQQSFLSETGEFVVKVSGEEVIRCARQ